MSYILDALKKADAEREREADAVPDLYAQADAERGARAAARGPGWVTWALGACALAAAVLAWRWFAAAPLEPALAQAPAAPVMSAALPATANMASPSPAPVPVVAAPAPMPLPQTAPAAPMPRAASPAPPPPRSVTAPAAKVAIAAPAQAAASTPRDASLPTLAELPPALRSQLPALAIGGSMYSPNPASRIVILNGQVFREGDQPLDGLAVERIGLKSTVLIYRGTRFELKH